jgi:hypothetical protein
LAKQQIKEFIANNTHYPEHNHVEVNNVQVEKPKSLVDDIRSCGDLKVLESYKLIVKNNATLRQVYNERLEQLSNQN